MEQPFSQVLPFVRRSKVIDEVDVAALLSDHADVRQMCDQVEALADRLLEAPDHDERTAIADLIQSRFRKHVEITSRFHERVIAGEQLRVGAGMLRRILLEQVAIGMHAEDVGEMLREKGVDASRTDMLSYMLRCLFDGCRRLLDYEELAFLYLGARRYTPGARISLEQVLDQASR